MATSIRSQKTQGNTLASLLIILAVLFVGGSWLFRGQAQGRTETIAQALGQAEQAELSLVSGVNVLRLREGTNDLLVGGTVQVNGRETLVQDFHMEGATAVYRLESQEQGGGFNLFSRNNRREWDLQVSPDIPLNLTVETGVGEVGLELTRLTLTNLRLRTGVGETSVVLPETGRFAATIESGVGELTIRIPKGLAARIEASKGIGNLDIDSTFERQGDLYMSPNFQSAPNRVELRVSGGVGEIRIEAF